MATFSLLRSRPEPLPKRGGGSFVIWLKLLTAAALAVGAWQSYRAMGKPVIRGGKRWYKQLDGGYRRWYGGRSYREDELP